MMSQLCKRPAYPGAWGGGSRVPTVGQEFVEAVGRPVFSRCPFQRDPRQAFPLRRGRDPWPDSPSQASARRCVPQSASEGTSHSATRPVFWIESATRNTSLMYGMRNSLSTPARVR